MKKYVRVLKRIFVLILAFVCSINTIVFSSVVDSFDGSSFVTKAELMQLQDELLSQIEKYNTSLDNKIDGTIANYISALKVNSTTLVSGLSKLSDERRTFVQSISNPTTSTQDDIYISTNGFWAWAHCTVYNEDTSHWAGYAFAGMNNKPSPTSGHNKWLVEANNGKNGKYMFIDKMKVGNPEKEVSYIYDNYRKYLQYKVTSCGARVVDQYTGACPNYGGPASISWSNTYNWTGQNDRKCSSLDELSVPALEALILLVSNDDYDTSKTGVQDVDWVSKTSGSTIFTTDMGSLLKADQYNWSFRKTNFSNGWSAQQALMRQLSTGSWPNSYNYGGDPRVYLNFNVPKITMLKGNNIAIRDVSNIAGEAAYYFSGLPLLTMPKTADKLIVKLKAVINKPSSAPTTESGLLLAIKNEQFKNVAINSETTDDHLVYKKEWTASTLPDANNDEYIRIELDYDEIYDSLDKTLWIKATATNSSCTVTLEPGEMYYY